MESQLSLVLQIPECSELQSGSRETLLSDGAVPQSSSVGWSVVSEKKQDMLYFSQHKNKRFFVKT